MRFAFLTGAGASYGAGRLLFLDKEGKLIVKPPPLGLGLYQELALEYPETWGNLPQRYQRAIREDFEIGMSSVWDDLLGKVQRLMIDMGRYFSRFNPSADGSDCYSRLVTAIRSNNLLGRASFATLNYECVLDIAVCRAGLKISYAGGARPAHNLSIWKLHGACNLVPKAHVYNITIAAQHILKGPVEPVQPSEVRDRYDAGLAIPPLMSVYMPGKPTQVTNPLLPQVRAEWASWVAECDVVVTIGVRPNLQEDYVWRPITDSRAEVWYIGGKDGQYFDLEDCIGDRIRHFASTFDEGIDPLLARLEAASVS